MTLELTTEQIEVMIELLTESIDASTAEYYFEIKDAYDADEEPAFEKFIPKWKARTDLLKALTQDEENQRAYRILEEIVKGRGQ